VRFRVLLPAFLDAGEGADVLGVTLLRALSGLVIGHGVDWLKLDGVCCYAKEIIRLTVSGVLLNFSKWLSLQLAIRDAIPLLPRSGVASICVSFAFAAYNALQAVTNVTAALVSLLRSWLLLSQDSPFCR
jgi:hypothetical protein